MRILLATDAASEGIDLQNHCYRLIHYEIPWNPNRMEQRNGRIDRHGQRAPAVQIYHFVGQGCREARSRSAGPRDLEADLEFLMRAARKVETDPRGPRQGRPGHRRPGRGGHARPAHAGWTGPRAEAEAEPVRRMLKFERDLRERVKELCGAAPGDAARSCA